MSAAPPKTGPVDGSSPPPNVRFSGSTPPPRVAENPRESKPLRVEDVIPPPARKVPKVVAHVRAFLKRHEKKLWWLHSVYALGLGTSVVLFANKGFDHARFLAISLGAVWLLLILFFRLFGEGKNQLSTDGASAKTKLGFFAVTYVLKNLYQGMLFFLLPYYWKSSTYGARNFPLVLVLGACALLSTLDVVFDRFLMRFRVAASVFYGVTLFACLNLVFPALFPETRSLVSLLVASFTSVVAFFTIHVRAKALNRPWFFSLLAAASVAGSGAAYAGRRFLPPVPMYLAHGAVGPAVLDDGRLSMEAGTLHTSVVKQVFAVTDVVIPGGKGDALVHIWRHDGEVVHRSTEATARVPGPDGQIRLRSTLDARDLAGKLAGSWSVDVETEDGQLVGRTAFQVIE